MAHALPGSLRRSLIATAAVMLLGTVGATCGVAVRGPADVRPVTISATAPIAVPAPARPEPGTERSSVGDGVK